MVEFQPFLTQEIELGCEHGFFQFSRKQVNVLRKKTSQNLYTYLGLPLCKRRAKLIFRALPLISDFDRPMNEVSLKGVTSQGFHGFLAQTTLKLVVANLIHSEHYLSEHLKEDITFNIDFLKIRGNNLKSLA